MAWGVADLAKRHLAAPAVASASAYNSPVSNSVIQQSFFGGLRLPGRKADSTSNRIQACPLPPMLVVPLQQHIGEPALPCVATGDAVQRGQVIGTCAGAGAAVHASASGRIVAIELRPVPHPSGLPQPCVVIQPDGSDVRERAAPLPDWSNAAPARLLIRLQEMGVVGLGGATFPTAEKLAVPRHTVILNAAECEPWISCDEALLSERAAELIEGARLLRHVVGAQRCIIALEDRMQAALAALREALGDNADGIELVELPTRYPQGGERQLIQALTGEEVPRGGLPRDIGVVVQNVATAIACWRAIMHGEALDSRIVTVTGPGVRNPGNFDVRLGTPIAWLIEQAGGYTACAERLLIGGPMMGTALPHDDLPISKSSNCVLVLGRADVLDEEPELPCIRCGECMRVCPARLLPQQLQAYARVLDMEQLQEHGLFDCIECGCCDLVCPSHIPLVDWYRYAKAELRTRGQAEAEAQAAKRRFEARGERLQRQAEEREAQRAAKSAAPDAVQAAIARARARKDAESQEAAAANRATQDSQD